jgi:hypothetical protein
MEYSRGMFHYWVFKQLIWHISLKEDVRYIKKKQEALSLITG